jgi:acyl carrier protein
MTDEMRDLERFVLDNVAAARKRRSIDPDEDLLARGTLDSLSLMEMVAFIERNYGIEVSDEELVMDNFRSLGRIRAFVEVKRAARI